VADPRRIAARWVQARLLPPPKMTRDVQDWAEFAFLEWLRARSVMPGGSRELTSRFYIQPSAEHFFKKPPSKAASEALRFNRVPIDLTGWKYEPSKEVFDKIRARWVTCFLKDESPKNALARWQVTRSGVVFGRITIFAENILDEHDLRPTARVKSQENGLFDLISEAELALKRLQEHEVKPEFERDKRWTVRFLDSILNQARQNRPLSKKQRALLEEKIKRYGSNWWRWSELSGGPWGYRPKYGRKQKLLPGIDAKVLNALVREVRQAAFHEMVHFSQYYLADIKWAEDAISSLALGVPSKGSYQGKIKGEEHAVREIEFYPRLQDEISDFLDANPPPGDLYTREDLDSLRRPMMKWVESRWFFQALESQKPRLHRKALSEFYNGVRRRAEEMAQD